MVVNLNISVRTQVYFKVVLLFLIVSFTNEKQKVPARVISTKKIKAIAPITVGLSKPDATKQAAKPPNEVKDCVFDQVTQTDEFLRGNKDLEGYKWNFKTKTATCILNNGDTLLIYRGGCNHFTVSAEFRFRNDKTDFSKWQKVYQKVLWIAKVLDKSFDYKSIKQEIDAGKVKIENYDAADVLTFENEDLANNDYAVERTITPQLTTITLSYTLT